MLLSDCLLVFIFVLFVFVVLLAQLDNVCRLVLKCEARGGVGGGGGGGGGGGELCDDTVISARITQHVMASGQFSSETV